jgi:hypothetical protein
MAQEHCIDNASGVESTTPTDRTSELERLKLGEEAFTGFESALQTQIM